MPALLTFLLGSLLLRTLLLACRAAAGAPATARSTGQPDTALAHTSGGPAGTHPPRVQEAHQ